MAPLRQRLSLRETVVVWALFGFVAAEIFATYSRLPVRKLYHVSGTGRWAGLGRVVVFLNWPTALVALAVLPLVAVRQRRLALVAAMLCAGIFWPGMVDQADLDVKWANAFPAAGVLLALALTLWELRGGIGFPLRGRGDRWRVALAVPLVLLSLPWLAADLGLSVDDVPGLRSIFMAGEWWAPFGHARLDRAVHAGHHHGMVGTLLALTALLLSRCLGRLDRPLRTALGLYLGVMLAYGLAVMTNDAWYEQLVKRGVTTWSFPSVIVPAPTLAWGVMLVAGLLLGVVFLQAADAGDPSPRPLPLAPLGLVAAAAVLTLVVIGAVHGPRREAQTPFARRGAGTIVFPMAGGGPMRLYAIGADGRGLRRLTVADDDELAPDWSQDAQLAIQSSREDEADVFVSKPDGSALQRLTGSGRQGEPAGAPDPDQIALIDDGDLYVVRRHDGGRRKIAEDAAWPTWAPDGRSLGYEVHFAGHGGIAASGSGSSFMPFGDADNRYPAWSPRGDSIAYECRRGGHWHICALDLASMGERPVTTGGGDEFAPAWSPDGSRIAFIGDRDGNDQLYVMRSDGTGIVRLTRGQADKDAPAWMP